MCDKNTKAKDLTAFNILFAISMSFFIPISIAVFYKDIYENMEKMSCDDLLKNNIDYSDIYVRTVFLIENARKNILKDERCVNFLYKQLPVDILAEIPDSILEKYINNFDTEKKAKILLYSNDSAIQLLLKRKISQDLLNYKSVFLLYKIAEILNCKYDIISENGRFPKTIVTKMQNG